MKFLLILIALSLNSWAMDCQVDGISDSPQKINCYIQNRWRVDTLDLVCQNLAYEVKWEDKEFPVNSAYHEEVESGSTPLVFLTDEFKLIVVSYRFYSSAYIETDKQRYVGLCFNR